MTALAWVVGAVCVLIGVFGGFMVSNLAGGIGWSVIGLAILFYARRRSSDSRRGSGTAEP